MSAGTVTERALVLGLGLSGAAAAGCLLRSGVPAVRVVERRDDAVTRTRADTLRAAGADVLLGETDPASALEPRPEVVVTSPGVPASHPLLTRALDEGIPVWSEPELAWRLGGGRTRLVAVTGTNGKTSTTELLAACLDAPAAGNIGTPLVELLAGAEAPARAVVELSSFQLHFTTTLRPDVAVLLNIAPDHLDWHGSLEAYVRDKARIWAAQDAAGWTVVNADDDGARRALADHPPRSRVLTFTLHPPVEGQVGVDGGQIVAWLPGRDPAPILPVTALSASGPHNLANALAAVGAALVAGAGPGDVATAVAAYRPGPHRLEVVAERGGVRWVDDSKATNPHAAAAALASFPSVVWIAGGLAKGLSFEPLADAVSAHVRAALTIGEAGPRIAELARSLGIPTEEPGDLATAVRRAAELAGPADVVLLAPACASMDQFTDYAARGRAFRDAVAALPGPTPAEEQSRVR
jgi:UDP-N-acetylmuramoylalanine--D-glutamate ligase